MKKKDLIREEWFPIVTEEGTVTGKALRNVCHDGKSKLLHPVVHLHLLNEKGELFMQKRSETKDIEPGKWDTSVGGHADYGETIEEALHREIYEEIGLKNINPVFITKYVWESTREKELVHSYYAFSGEALVLNKDEIEDGKFRTLEEIRENIGKKIFTPNFEFEFAMIDETLSRNFER